MKHEHDHHEHNHGHEHGPGCGHIEVHEHSMCASGLCGHIEHMRTEMIRAQINELSMRMNLDDDYVYDEFGRKVRKKKGKTTKWQPIYT